jgi:glyoxylase-like metal-dependent hydrolase (beta-lactamase superfamily II)
MRSYLKSGITGALVLFLVGLGSAPAQDLAKVQIKTVPVAGNIFLLIGSGGNIGVSVGEDGVLLVDDEFPELVEKIKAAVAQLDPGPIRFVLNTNWHYDHANGNELLTEGGAIVIAHENSRKHMLGEQRLPELYPDLKIPPYPKKALPVITVTNALTLHFNGDEIRMAHVPNAHSDGDLLFRFVKANVVHAGDLFFSNGFPFINISAGGTVEGMIKAAEEILGMCDERTKVIPGHGPLSDREGVRAFKDLLVAGRDRIAALVKQGKSLDETVAAKPAEGLYKGGKSWLSPDMFVKIVYQDLTGEFRKK